MAAPVFSQPGADVFVPDGTPIEQALERTTHLGIAAHADDLEFFAWHGISACFGSKERWFTGIILSDGAGSPRTGRYAGYSEQQMIEARRAEQRAAAIIGEYSIIIQLAHPSTALKNPAHLTPVQELSVLLGQMQPEVVYLHNPADRHDTHIACFLRSLAALRAQPQERRPAKVYGCEVWRDLDWLVGDSKVALPAGDRPHLQAALAGVFDTQISGGKRYDLAVAGRRLANATFHDSHSVDTDQGLTFAMDLTPLVQDDALDPVAFTLAHVKRLADDVWSRFTRVG